MHRFEVIPLWAAHEIARDLGDVLARAIPRLEATRVRRLWTLCPPGPLDACWAAPQSPVHAPFLRALTQLEPDACGLVLATRSAVVEACRAVPAGDAAHEALGRLVAGEGLFVSGRLLLAFDDGDHPHLGLFAPPAELAELRARIGALADPSVPVLVVGETGTGKEAIAHALHRLGRRAGRPWVAINCAALPEALLESELFGHDRGAFTGADGARPGLLETAEDGTVLLDEIGELPLGAQAKLLRVLEDHRVRRVGGHQPRLLRCRIVAATNRSLEREAGCGRFRHDLLYRLRAAEIRLEALRRRPSEIRGLAEHFAARAALRFGRPPVEIEPGAGVVLASHRWPGNVRELRQVVEGAVLRARGRRIGAADLEISSATAGGDGRSPFVTMEEVVRGHILHALQSTDGNKMAAARLLGITRQSLQRRLDRMQSLETASGRGCPITGAESGR